MIQNCILLSPRLILVTEPGPKFIPAGVVVS
jgi:hypothetical protein